MAGGTGILPLHGRPELVSGLATALRTQRRQDALRYWRIMARRLVRLAMGLGAAREEAEADVRLLLHSALASDAGRGQAPAGPLGRPEPLRRFAVNAARTAGPATTGHGGKEVQG